MVRERGVHPEIATVDRVQIQFANLKKTARQETWDARRERFGVAGEMILFTYHRGNLQALNTKIQTEKRNLAVLKKMDKVNSTYLDDGCLVSCQFGDHQLSVDARNPNRASHMNGMVPLVVSDNQYYLDGKVVKTVKKEGRTNNIADNTAGEIYPPFSGTVLENNTDQIDPELNRAFDFLGQLATTGSLFPRRERDILEDVIPLIS